MYDLSDLFPGRGPPAVPPAVLPSRYFILCKTKHCMFFIFNKFHVLNIACIVYFSIFFFYIH